MLHMNCMAATNSSLLVLHSLFNKRFGPRPASPVSRLSFASSFWVHVMMSARTKAKTKQSFVVLFVVVDSQNIDHSHAAPDASGPRSGQASLGRGLTRILSTSLTQFKGEPSHTYSCKLRMSAVPAKAQRRPDPPEPEPDRTQPAGPYAVPAIRAMNQARPARCLCAYELLQAPSGGFTTLGLTQPESFTVSVLAQIPPILSRCG